MRSTEYIMADVEPKVRWEHDGLAPASSIEHIVNRKDNFNCTYESYAKHL